VKNIFKIFILNLEINAEYGDLEDEYHGSLVLYEDERTRLQAELDWLTQQ